jgi:hypothetical protein
VSGINAGWHYSQTVFDQLLVESVDQTLADLLGERVRNQIYDHLAIHHNPTPEDPTQKIDIPQRIDDVYGFLDKAFASAGRTIGRTILRQLFDRLGYEFVDVPGFGFIDYLEAVKTRAARDADRVQPARPTRKRQ